MSKNTATAADKAASKTKSRATAAADAPNPNLNHGADASLVKVAGASDDTRLRDEDGNVIVTPPADPREYARQALAAAQSRPEYDGPSVEGDGERVTLESVQVQIVRDAMAKIPVTVFTYELAVLFTLHGQDSIEVNQGSFRMQEVEDFSVERVYDQLLRKYGTDGEAAVRKVYPSLRDLADEVGVEVNRRVRRGANYKAQTQGSSEIDHSLGSPKAEKEVSAPKAGK